MRRYRNLLLLGAILGGMTLSTPMAHAAGKVISLEGKATLFRNEPDKGSLLRYGDPVQPGDTIETAADAKLKMLFDDDSLVTLGPSSRLKITTQLFDASSKQRQTLLKLIYGKVRTLVPKLRELFKSSYEVETPNAVAGVRGTYFVTTYVPPSRGTNGTTGVYTYEGSVALRFMPGAGQPGGTINVPADHYAVGSGGAVQPQPLDATTRAQLDRDTQVEEKPPQIDSPEGHGITNAPPNWLPPQPGIPGQGGPGPGPGYSGQFFGNGTNGPIVEPPIQQQPPANVLKTPVQVHVNGVPNAN